MTITLDELERKYYQEQYSPGSSVGKAIYKENLVLNASVGSLSNVSSWAGVGGSATLSQGADGGKVGSTYSKVTWTVATTSPSGGAKFNNVVAVPGKKYSAYVWVRCSKVQSMVAGFEFNRANSSQIAGANASGPPVTLQPNVWTRLVTLDKVAPAETAFINVTAFAVGPGVVNWAPGDTLDADAACAQEGYAVDIDFFMGDSPNPPARMSYQWAGAAYNSKSQLVTAEPIKYTNLIPLSSGEILTDATANSCTGSLSSLNKEPGSSNSFLLTPTGSAGNDSFIQFFGKMSQAVSNVKLGGTYTISGWCYAVGPTVSSTLHATRARKICLFSRAPSTGAPYIEIQSAQVPFNQLTRVSVTFTVPYDVTELFGRFYNGSDNAADLVYWSGLSVVEGTVPITFNGNHPNAFWHGTPGNSLSSLIDVDARSVDYLERSFWAKSSALTPKEKFSVADHMKNYLDSLYPGEGTITDKLMKLYQGGSGLAPVEKFSIADHMYKYFKVKLGL